VCTVGVGHNFVVAKCGQGGEHCGARQEDRRDDFPRATVPPA
jgi:hypothetical protein